MMRPLSDSITAVALRELQRGNIASGVAVEAVNNRLGSIVEDTITQFLGTNEADVRRLLADARTARDRRAVANQVGTGLMRNTRFRRQLERNLERAAERGR